ncbi:MAG TPA: ABC transporter substrate-binding protein [Terriglobales bacterium]|nr:ABC transporter substrate-binding protein [Terriglobales bacterium]
MTSRALAVLALVLLAACLAPIADVAAQRPARAVRVAHVSGTGAAPSKPYVAAFRESLRALGWSEQHVVIDERYAEGNVQRLPGLLQELIERKPDILLVATTPGNLAAKAATSTIPIVFALVADPVGAGIVASLARPGANVTGVTNIVAELAGKRVELLRELVPTATRVAVIVNPDDQNAPLQLRHAEATAKRLGIQLTPILEVRNLADLEKAFETAAKANVPAAMRMIDPLVFIYRKETAALAAKHRVPVIYPTRDEVEAGGLIGYGSNIPEQFRQAAVLVDRILQGAKPADIPVQQPTKFDLVINAKTAKALKIAIPASLLVRAEVVE